MTATPAIRNHSFICDAVIDIPVHDVSAAIRPTLEHTSTTTLLTFIVLH
jgi:hypothetical protein